MPTTPGCWQHCFCFHPYRNGTATVDCLMIRRYKPSLRMLRWRLSLCISIYPISVYLMYGYIYTSEKICVGLGLMLAPIATETGHA